MSECFCQLLSGEEFDFLVKITIAISIRCKSQSNTWKKQFSRSVISIDPNLGLEDLDPKIWILIWVYSKKINLDPESSRPSLNTTYCYPYLVRFKLKTHFNLHYIANTNAQMCKHHPSSCTFWVFSHSLIPDYQITKKLVDPVQDKRPIKCGWSLCTRLK